MTRTVEEGPGHVRRLLVHRLGPHGQHQLLHHPLPHLRPHPIKAAPAAPPPAAAPAPRTVNRSRPERSPVDAPNGHPLTPRTGLLSSPKASPARHPACRIAARLCWRISGAGACTRAFIAAGLCWRMNPQKLVRARARVRASLPEFAGELTKASARARASVCIAAPAPKYLCASQHLRHGGLGGLRVPGAARLCWRMNPPKPIKVSVCIATPAPKCLCVHRNTCAKVSVCASQH